MSIYPSEVWPAETTVLSVDGGIDAATGLPFIAKGTGPTSSPSYEVQYNRRQMRQNAILAACRQGMVVDEGNLRIGAYPIEYTLLGARRSFVGATGVAVPDNVQRVVYLGTAASLQVAAAWPSDPASYLPLAEVMTANGTLSIVDRRVRTLFQVPVGRRYLTAFSAQVANNQNGAEIFEFDPAEAMVLEQVQVFCTGAAATASVDVKQAGTSLLGAPASPVAGSVIKPAIATAAIAAGQSLTVHVTTNTTGAVSNLHVTLVLRGE